MEILCSHVSTNYVITAESVNSFKSRLDKFWKHQELMYNYTDLNCTEPGAEVSLIGNFVTSIKKVYVRSRLRGFACACRISTSTSTSNFKSEIGIPSYACSITFCSVVVTL